MHLGVYGMRDTAARHTGVSEYWRDAQATTQNLLGGGDEPRSLLRFGFQTGDTIRILQLRPNKPG